MCITHRIKNRSTHITTTSIFSKCRIVNFGKVLKVHYRSHVRANALLQKLKIKRAEKQRKKHMSITHYITQDKLANILLQYKSALVFSIEYILTCLCKLFCQCHMWHMHVFCINDFSQFIFLEGCPCGHAQTVTSLHDVLQEICIT